jgi:hypothetical protein
LSFVSIPEFPGLTASGVYSSEGQVAVSHDLREYLGYWCYIEGEFYKITDLTNRRFKKTVDVYVDLPGRAVRKLGIFNDVEILIMPIKWDDSIEARLNMGKE